MCVSLLYLIPSVSHSVCIPTRVYPAPCISLRLRVYSSPFVFHSVCPTPCIPLRVCSTQCISHSVCIQLHLYPTPCIPFRISHSVCIPLRVYLILCLSSSVCIQLRVYSTLVSYSLCFPLRVPLHAYPTSCVSHFVCPTPISYSVTPTPCIPCPNPCIPLLVCRTLCVPLLVYPTQVRLDTMSNPLYLPLSVSYFVLLNSTSVYVFHSLCVRVSSTRCISINLAGSNYH